MKDEVKGALVSLAVLLVLAACCSPADAATVETECVDGYQIAVSPTTSFQMVDSDSSAIICDERLKREAEIRAECKND